MQETLRKEKYVHVKNQFKHVYYVCFTDCFFVYKVCRELVTPLCFREGSLIIMYVHKWGMEQRH